MGVALRFGGATAAFTGVGAFVVGISVSDLWAPSA
jgi:hypothetical protein